MASSEKGFKIAIAGKGGVGKTTVAAGLARLFADEGRRVIAVDADPDANLGAALGASPEQLEALVPLARMDDLIAERAGSPGGFFRLNPKVDDLPEKISIDVNGVKLLVLGLVEKGGSGCICPESAMLKALVRHLVIEADDVVILDMEAGIEHLGRGTAAYTDAFIAIAESGRRSIQTAKAVAKLAAEIGVAKCFLAVNKVRSQEESLAVRRELSELTFLGSVSENEEIREADISGRACEDPRFLSELAGIKSALVQKIAEATVKEKALKLETGS